MKKVFNAKGAPAHLLKAVKAFVADRPEVTLAFIFGSFIGGRMSEESDIDLAILFKKAPDLNNYMELKEKLSDSLKREVDLIILNTAPPIIKFQILKQGLIFKQDERAYSDFFIQTIKEYDDLKYFRKEVEKNLLRGRIYG
jgi:predicted nucleotidyltransferase